MNEHGAIWYTERQLLRINDSHQLSVSDNQTFEVLGLAIPENAKIKQGENIIFIRYI